jgi:hypothetical protein
VVFAVWEPILPTDWSAPGAGALGRLSDQRVQQFWDPNHLMAAVLKKAEESGHLHPDCCVQKGTLWDLTAGYVPGVVWRDDPKEAGLFNGPVVRTPAELEALLAKSK